MTTLKINGKQHTLNLEPETPLLWALRDSVGMTVTKYGCAIQRCSCLLN
jgi:isoquinoline 1-oxidoreductase alpha subunit